jgi:hypothetical protein
VAFLVTCEGCLEILATKLRSVPEQGQVVVALVITNPPSLLKFVSSGWKPFTIWKPVKPMVSLPAIRLVLISHFFNEELLLPFWIRHHAPMFDAAVLIDYNSTDKSRDILKALAPASWLVVSSRNLMFSAQECDAEVSFYEQQFPDSWKIALTTTEFLVNPRIRELSLLSASAVRFPSFLMIGEDTIPLNFTKPLLLQRSQYGMDPRKSSHIQGVTSYSRYMHRLPSVKYGFGRHDIDANFVPSPAGFIAKYLWTPWPESLSRKAQIRARLPAFDIAHGFGAQHNTDSERLKSVRMDVMNSWTKYDFRDSSIIGNYISKEVEDAHSCYFEMYGTELQ